jgi:hypothetical protein
VPHLGPPETVKTLAGLTESFGDTAPIPFDAPVTGATLLANSRCMISMEASYSPTLSVSVRSRRVEALFLHLGPEVTDQVGASRWVTVAQLSRANPVGSEESQAFAQFAPVRQQAGFGHKAEQDRPNHPLGRAATLVNIGFCARIADRRTASDTAFVGHGSRRPPQSKTAAASSV